MPERVARAIRHAEDLRRCRCPPRAASSGPGNLLRHGVESDRFCFELFNHKDPIQLAQRTIQAWKHLRTDLTAAGLLVNSHKTAFIVTDKVIHKELAKLLGPDDPPIQSVMRDLGIDHSAGGDDG